MAAVEKRDLSKERVLELFQKLNEASYELDSNKNLPTMMEEFTIKEIRHMLQTCTILKRSMDEITRMIKTLQTEDGSD